MSPSQSGTGLNPTSGTSSSDSGPSSHPGNCSGRPRRSRPDSGGSAPSRMHPVRSISISSSTGIRPPMSQNSPSHTHGSATAPALQELPSSTTAPRPIAIDTLLYWDHTTDEPELTIPHPRIGERAFVLRPLLELDPELHDPRTGRRIAELLETGELEEIRKSFPGTEL